MILSAVLLIRGQTEFNIPKYIPLIMRIFCLYSIWHQIQLKVVLIRVFPCFSRTYIPQITNQGYLDFDIIKFDVKNDL